MWMSLLACQLSGSARANPAEIRAGCDGRVFGRAAPMNATLGVVGQDLRQAMRVLRNNVGYSTVAIVTLALGIGAKPRSEVFFPVTQFPFAPWTALQAMTFVVRTDGDPLSIAEVAKTAVQAADKDLPVTRVRPMTKYMAESLERRRFSTLLLAAFAGLALLLAAGRRC